MANNNGWIKLHRGILDWEWYHDPNTFRVFLHLLLTANYEDNEYMGVDLKRGECIITVRELAEEVQQTVRQTRTALEHLKSTQEITIRTTNRFSIVKIANYEKYQQVQLVGTPVDNSEDDTPNDKQSDNQTTNETQKNDTPNDTPHYNKEIYKEILNKEIKNNAHACAREEPVDNFDDERRPAPGSAAELEEVIRKRREKGEKVSTALLMALEHRRMVENGED